MREMLSPDSITMRAINNRLVAAGFAPIGQPAEMAPSTDPIAVGRLVSINRVSSVFENSLANSKAVDQDRAAEVFGIDCVEAVEGSELIFEVRTPRRKLRHVDVLKPARSWRALEDHGD